QEPERQIRPARPDCDGAYPAAGLASARAVAGAMLWLPQAGLLAWAVSGIAAGEPAAALAWPALGVLALGLARAVLEAAAGRLAWRAARARLSALRAQAVAALSARSPLDAGRVPSGEAASILAEQAEAVVPWLARFQPVRLKAAVLPLVILAAILPFSWTAAVVLLVAMPVIPVFMVLVGWKAKAASAAQMVEVGDV